VLFVALSKSFNQMQKTLPANIKQKNLITAARYVFSLTEKRILYLVAAKLNGQENLFGEQVVEIPINALLKDDNENYTLIKQAAKTLITRTIEIKQVDRWECFSILAGAVIINKSGSVQLTLSHHVVPYFVELSKSPDVTTIGLNYALSLKSIYSQRFYEFISRYKDTGWWTIGVEQLRSMLKLESKYNQWEAFQRRVLLTAQKELAEKTDIGFTYTCIKDGKKIVRLDFKIFPVDKKTNSTEFVSSIPVDINIIAIIGKLREKFRFSEAQAKHYVSTLDAKDINQRFTSLKLIKRPLKIHQRGQNMY